VTGFSGARYKKFESKEEADTFMRMGDGMDAGDSDVGTVSIPTHILPLLENVYVDGSYWAGRMGMGIFYLDRDDARRRGDIACKESDI
jgi:hypothetical protein